MDLLNSAAKKCGGEIEKSVISIKQHLEQAFSISTADILSSEYLQSVSSLDMKALMDELDYSNLKKLAISNKGREFLVQKYNSYADQETEVLLNAVKEGKNELPKFSAFDQEQVQFVKRIRKLTSIAMLNKPGKHIVNFFGNVFEQAGSLVGSIIQKLKADLPAPANDAEKRKRIHEEYAFTDFIFQVLFGRSTNFSSALMMLPMLSTTTLGIGLTVEIVSAASNFV